MAGGLVLGSLVPSLNDGLDRLRIGTVSLPIALGPPSDDVPRPREGPLRGAGSDADGRRLRTAVLRNLALSLVGRRSAVHVCPRVAVSRGSARVPDGRDHRRPRTLHRDGADLERPREGRPRPRRGARRVQRRVPGRGLLAARLLLPDRPPRLARTRHAGFRGRDLGGRAHRARSSSASRLPPAS